MASSGERLLALLKRFRELLLVAVLLLFPLVVFFANAKRPAELSRVDRVVLAATRPIEKAVGWMVTGALRGWQGYVDLRRARERAAELTRELDRLRLERQDLVQERAEGERLRRLLAFAQASRERTFVGARVIGVRLDPKGLQLVTLDRGNDHGVRKMMPVVTADGVVGRVHSVLAGTSDVLLVADRNSSIAVRVERSRARANVRGLGEPGPCKLDYALRSDDMIEGDLLVTSGTDGVFPRGLPVGRVNRVRRTGYGLYQSAEVAPAVDVAKLEEVLVITSADRGAQEAPAALAP
jgi:rod shape-determining protein MreC